MPIREDQQKLDVGNLVELFELHLHRIGIYESYYWSPSIANGGASYVQWNGNDYIALDIDASGFEWNSKGAFPTPRLKVSNVFNAFSALNATYNDLIGCEVDRILTLEKYLDGESDADTSEYFSFDRYRIDRKVLQNKIYVEYELASYIDQEGKQLPARQFQRDTCNHTYRKYNPTTMSFSYYNVTCPYAGTATFDAKGQPCEPANDACSKKLFSGCIKRFGTDNVPTEGLPFRGFPAMTDSPI